MFIFINMNRGFLNLLEAADHELYEMYKSWDEELADEKLEIEIARQFIHKALDSEDRMDIFKALQKTYDIFAQNAEIESDLEDKSKGYTSMAEQLKKALEGLQEGIITKSELKKLTKFILKEIGFPKDNRNKSLFHMLFGGIVDKPIHPMYRDVNEAKKICDKLINDLQNSIKRGISSTAKQDPNETEMWDDSSRESQSMLLNIFSVWIHKIVRAFPQKENYIHTLYISLGTHMEQMILQYGSIIRSHNEFHNYVNAIKEIRHLDEIFINFKRTVGEFFDLAEKLPVEKGFEPPKGTNVPKKKK
jgi:hypothetical protein